MKLSTDRAAASLKPSEARHRRAFTLQIGQHRVLTMLASSIEEAQVLASADWFREELAQCSSSGRPLCDEGVEWFLHPATALEELVLREAQIAEIARHGETEFAFAYLVPIDVAPN